MSQKAKRLLGWGSLGILILGLGWTFRAPLTTRYFQIRQKLELREAGVRSIQVDGLQGLERDSCRDPKNCLCIFLIHGMGDSSLTWRKVFQAREGIPAETRLIAPDLPGMGESPLPEEPRDLQVSQIARRFNRYLESRGCLHTRVVGNSFGGWIALWMAIDSVRPEWGHSLFAIQRVVSLGGVGLKREGEDDGFLDRLRKAPTIDLLKEFQRRAYFQPREYPPEFWEEALRRMQSSKSVDLSEAQTPDQNLDDVRQALPMAFHYYWGEADRIVPRETGERLARAFAGQFHVIPRCGHLPQKECPQAVISAIFSER